METEPAITNIEVKDNVSMSPTKTENLNLANSFKNREGNSMTRVKEIPARMSPTKTENIKSAITSKNREGNNMTTMKEIPAEMSPRKSENLNSVISSKDRESNNMTVVKEIPAGDMFTINAINDAETNMKAHRVIANENNTIVVTTLEEGAIASAMVSMNNSSNTLMSSLVNIGFAVSASESIISDSLPMSDNKIDVLGNFTNARKYITCNDANSAKPLLDKETEREISSQVSKKRVNQNKDLNNSPDSNKTNTGNNDDLIAFY